MGVGLCNKYNYRPTTVTISQPDEYADEFGTLNLSLYLYFQVQTILLDDLFSLPHFSEKMAKCIMKIDIEGHEISTLMAAKKLWQRLDIAVVLMEWEWIPIKYEKTKDTPSSVTQFLNFMTEMTYIAREPDYGRELKHGDWRIWPANVAWVKKTFPF